MKYQHAVASQSTVKKLLQRAMERTPNEPLEARGGAYARAIKTLRRHPGTTPGVLGMTLWPRLFACHGAIRLQERTLRAAKHLKALCIKQIERENQQLQP